MQGTGTAAWTAALAAAVIAAATMAQAADVVVHRGSKVSSESARTVTTTVSRGVAVQRGHAVARKPAPPKKPGTGRFTTAVGEDLWIIDRQRNRVINCGIEGSSDVGGERIRCAQTSVRSILR